MILTLQFMVIDTIAFMLLLAAWLLLSAFCFTTLFQDTENNVYSNLYTTVQLMYNSLLGGYSNIGIGLKLYNLHIIVNIFYVYMSNILLLNYLIAIMSTTYGNMMDSGIFMYKVNLYNYCERYLTAFKNSYYSEFVLHTAPINVLIVPI
jgi:hypothetical protein